MMLTMQKRSSYEEQEDSEDNPYMSQYLLENDKMI